MGQQLWIRSVGTAPEGKQNTILSEQQQSNYNGPLSQTFRRLKIFSASSLALSTSLAPFLLVVESNLPFSARFALASIAVGTSCLSTGLVGWCGKSYVNTLRRFQTGENTNSSNGIEMTTSTLLLKPRITRVYDPHFLTETSRPFSKWELASTLVVPSKVAGAPGTEETVAETMNKHGEILGRWIVSWGMDGEGKCRQDGRVIRYFNVDEKLLK